MSDAPIQSESAPSTFDVLYNARYGGFTFSDEFVERYNELKPSDKWWKIPRDCELAVRVFKELGSDRSSGQFSSIRIETIPIKYKRCFVINEYDGSEWVTINHADYVLHLLQDNPYADKSRDELAAILRTIQTELEPEVPIPMPIGAASELDES